MSAYADIKGDFLREAAQAGWTQAHEISEKWGSTLPPNIAQRWLRQHLAVVEVDPAQPRRLVNHFKLGADPEFAFINPANSERTDATAFGLRAAMAWGADNNGRLAEIRPAPSRSALAVTASIWATLHWMSRLNPSTRSYMWRTGAWFANDGMGGHIHFGRKRPTWEREVQALDTLAFWLSHINILNQNEWSERIRRTRGRGNYGQLGDRRVQAHGWEFRSLPSWLDSPWMAFCLLTLSKLAVHDPEFLPQLTSFDSSMTAAQVRNRLRGMLTYFKSKDDDAAFAYQIFQRVGWPRYALTDFKLQWGIYATPAPDAKTPSWLYPSQITVTPEVVAELAKGLIVGQIPEFPEITPSWQPNTLPKGYSQAIALTETFHRPGIGELIRDLAVSSEGKFRPSFLASGNRYLDVVDVYVPNGTEQTKWIRKFPSLHIRFRQPEDRGNRIYLPGEAASSPELRQQVVEFLTAGWGPIWLTKDVKPGSYGEWYGRWSQAPKAKPKTRQASVQVFPTKAEAADSESAPVDTGGLQGAINRLHEMQVVQEAMYAAPEPTPTTTPVQPSPGIRWVLIGVEPIHNPWNGRLQNYYRIGNGVQEMLLSTQQYSLWSRTGQLPVVPPPAPTPTTGTMRVTWSSSNSTTGGNS